MINNNISEILKKKNMSQLELARRADALNPGMISQIASGARRPSPRTMQRIAYALNMQVDSVFPQAAGSRRGADHAK